MHAMEIIWCGNSLFDTIINIHTRIEIVTSTLYVWRLHEKHEGFSLSCMLLLYHIKLQLNSL